MPREHKDLTTSPAVVLGMFETGLGVGRSLGRAGVRVTGFDSTRKVGFHSKYIKASLCPHPIEHEKEFVDFLARFGASQLSRPVLFVTSDEFVLPVSRNREELEHHYLLNIPDPKILECIADKYKQHELARHAGIPVPETFCVSDMDQLQDIKNKIPLPAFIKGADVTAWRHKFGSAVKGFTVRDQRELLGTSRMIFEQGVTGLIQELIEGPDTCHYKASCYVSRKGEILLAFGLQKLRQHPVNYGFGCLVQSLQYPELLQLGRNFFLRIGYRGVGSAEFKLDQRDGKLKLIELNPRYWQQNALADKCGMNFPLTHYLDLTGHEPKPILDFREGVRWVNIYSDFESFREYRRRGQLSVIPWLRSLGGEMMYSDLSSDDVFPGLHEMFFGNILRRPARFLMKKLRSGFRNLT